MTHQIKDVNFHTRFVKLLNRAASNVFPVLFCSVLSACSSTTPQSALGSMAGGSLTSANEPERPLMTAPAPAAAPRSAPEPAEPSRTMEAAAGSMAPSPDAKSGAILVRVYYATDRKFEAEKKTYGWQPNRAAPHLSYGSVLVSVPEKRMLGEVQETPWWYFNFSRNASKHMFIQERQRWSHRDFFTAVKKSLSASPDRQAAFIYVHGYYNSFDSAALRTAQMAVDLDVGAIPVFYSWPSRNQLAAYPFDDNSAQWTQSHLQSFLADFADHSSATDIYIIAHSMGNRPATIALANLLEKRPELLARFKQVILAAPDINADVFREQIAPRLASLGLPVTLYASKNDKAIRASYQFAGWDRIGDIRGDIVSMPGLDFIDASNVTMNFIGHDYVSSNRALLTDIATMIKTGERAKRRGGLRGKPSPAPRHWEFP